MKADRKTFCIWLGLLVVTVSAWVAIIDLTFVAVHWAIGEAVALLA